MLAARQIPEHRVFPGLSQHDCGSRLGDLDLVFKNLSSEHGHLSFVALNGALLVNAAILVLAAAVFYKRHIVVTEIQQAYLLLAPLLGTAAAGIVFALALLASGQSSTLTGSFLTRNDSTGVPGGAANLNVLIGLPITFNNPVLGSIPDVQPEAILASGTNTATFNAGSIGGLGHADATVDQQTVTANIIILQPPSIAKSFNPVTVPVNAVSTSTFSITNGNVIAINTAIYGPQGNIGLGFALPINRAKGMLEEFSRTGNITRPVLGVSVLPVSGDLAEMLNLPHTVLPVLRNYTGKMPALADCGYEGAGHGILTPVKKPKGVKELDISTRTRNMLLSSARCLGERGFALLSQRGGRSGTSPQAPAR